MMIEHYDHWLCTDCMLFAVNGELPIDDERDAPVMNGVERLGPHLVPNFEIDADGDDGHDEFSRNECDACRTVLAGERFRFATLVQETSDEHHHPE